jgi:hypothetical protein
LSPTACVPAGPTRPTHPDSAPRFFFGKILFFPGALPVRETATHRDAWQWRDILPPRRRVKNSRKAPPRFSRLLLSSAAWRGRGPPPPASAGRTVASCATVRPPQRGGPHGVSASLRRLLAWAASSPAICAAGPHLLHPPVPIRARSQTPPDPPLPSLRSIARPDLARGSQQLGCCAARHTEEAARSR